MKNKLLTAICEFFNILLSCILLIAFIISALILCVVITVPTITLLLVNYIILRITLNSLIKEYKVIHNIRILYFSSLNIPTKDGIKYSKIPLNPFKLPSFIRKTKLRLGSVKHHCYYSDISDINFINSIKTNRTRVSFFTLNKNSKILEHIHLYNLSKLSSDEITSILSLNICDYQKQLIYKRYTQQRNYL